VDIGGFIAWLTYHDTRRWFLLAQLIICAKLARTFSVCRTPQETQFLYAKKKHFQFWMRIFFFFLLLCLLHQPYTFEIKMVSIFVNLKKYIYFLKNVLEIVVFNFLTFNIRFDNITLLITFSPPTYPYLPFFHTFLHFFFFLYAALWSEEAVHCAIKHTWE